MKVRLSIGGYESLITMGNNHSLVAGITSEVLKEANLSTLLIYILNGMDIYSEDAATVDPEFLTPFIRDLENLQKKWRKREEKG